MSLADATETLLLTASFTNLADSADIRRWTLKAVWIYALTAILEGLTDNNWEENENIKIFHGNYNKLTFKIFNYS